MSCEEDLWWSGRSDQPGVQLRYWYILDRPHHSWTLLHLILVAKLTRSGYATQDSQEYQSQRRHLQLQRQLPGLAECVLAMDNLTHYENASTPCHSQVRVEQWFPLKSTPRAPPWETKAVVELITEIRKII